MDASERASLIRKGNECFNSGDIKQAVELFVRTGYRDGLTRVGDYYFYDRRQPLLAVKFYRMAGVTSKVEEIQARMVMALSQWLGGGESKRRAPRVELPPLKVSPKLKILAEEILRREKGEG